MKPFWMAVCAVALGACAPAARPAPPPPTPPSRPLPPPPALPEPSAAPAPESHGPEAIREQLFREHPQRAGLIASLRITEDDGAVTLVGFVPDEQTCRELLASVRHVAGVRAVRNDLLVLEHPAPAVGVAGSRTGDAIKSWLQRERPDAVGAGDSLKVYEQDGFVTLYGKVNDERARRDLVSRVKQMPDVKQVDDRLEVEHPGAAPPGSIPASMPVRASH
ncbi:MAG TPA: BON domain-containing protein [Polyangiaceae bacterium]|nr:BON domain-containing protein [Polyangiaceae bacterium]